MKARVSGAWRDISAGKIKVDGVWRTVTRIVGKVSGAWEDFVIFTPPFSAAISPATAVAYDLDEGDSIITTNGVTAIPTGGTGPYSYEWDGGVASLTAGTSATTAFLLSTTLFSGVFTETWTVTITDSLGQVATATIDAEFHEFGS